MNMKFVLVIAVVSMCATVSCAAVEPPEKPAESSANAQDGKPRKKMTYEHQQELFKRVNMKRYGGHVRKAGSAEGAFVVLNAQKVVPSSAFDSAIKMLDETVNLRAFVREVDKPVSVENAKELIESAGGSVGVVLVENEGLPTLLTAPESGWSIVNVGALAVDKPAADRLASRVRKEILRSLAFVTGGAYMSRGDYVMRDVSVPSDLDGLRYEQYGFDTLARFEESMKLYGIRPWYQRTYRQACTEGWAPDPTNQWQKAIWDEIHELPTKPITIEPESKAKK